MEKPVTPPPSKRRRVNTWAEGPATLPGQSITIYSWNVNGIAPFVQQSITSFFKAKDGGETQSSNAKASLRDFLFRHRWPTVLFLQEVKVNPDDTSTLLAVEKAVRRKAGEPPEAYDYEVHFCLPSDKHNARGFDRKIYGVCSIVRKDFSDRYVDTARQVDWDAEGRFLVIETKADGNLPKLAIFNAYMVNGTDYPYKDPTSGDIMGIRHDRKLRVHALLQAECRALEADGFGVIIAGDLNIARSEKDGHPNLRTFPKQHCINRADFEVRFFSVSGSQSSATARFNELQQQKKAETDEVPGLGMIDSFRHLHPDQRAYTYFPRTKTFGDSCDRVDAIIISNGLKEDLKEAGMHETPSDRGPSDHVPLYARLAFGEGPTNSND